MSSRRQGWRFLLSRRWVSYFVLMVIFAIACGFLSHWQFDRRDERVDENHKVAVNYDAEPVPIAEALPTRDAYSDAQEWLPVELTGEYLLEEQVLARARPKDGMPGFEILTPFRTNTGEIFIVNRGWIPTGAAQDDPDHIPAAPEGELTVTVRLKPGEPEIPGRSAPAGQIATINLPTLNEWLGGNVYTGAYGLLRSESVAAETGALTPKPQPTEGNHLSYAVQWIIFAVIALVGLVYGIREEFRERNESDPRVIAARKRERERKQRRGPTDADEEDALIAELEQEAGAGAR